MVKYVEFVFETANEPMYALMHAFSSWQGACRPREVMERAVDAAKDLKTLSACTSVLTRVTLVYNAKALRLAKHHQKSEETALWNVFVYHLPNHHPVVVAEK